MVAAKCVECGKEYELENDQKISDFECECGGELKNKKITIEPGQIESNSDNKSNLLSCPDCGHDVSKKAKSCPNCGRELTYEDIHGHKHMLKLEELIVMIITSFLVFLVIAYLWESIIEGAFVCFLIISIILILWYIIDRKS